MYGSSTYFEVLKHVIDAYVCHQQYQSIYLYTDEADDIKFDEALSYQDGTPFASFYNLRHTTDIKIFKID